MTITHDALELTIQTILDMGTQGLPRPQLPLAWDLRVPWPHLLLMTSGGHHWTFYSNLFTSGPSLHWCWHLVALVAGMVSASGQYILLEYFLVIVWV